MARAHAKNRAAALFARPEYKARIDAAVVLIDANPRTAEDDLEQALCDADGEREIEAAAARQEQAACDADIERHIAAARNLLRWPRRKRAALPTAVDRAERDIDVMKAKWRLEERQQIKTSEELAEHLRGQKAEDDEKRIKEDAANRAKEYVETVKRLASSTRALRDWDREKDRLRKNYREREFHKSQAVLPGILGFDNPHAPLLAMPLPVLMQKIEDNFQLEDNSTRLANSIMLAVAERRFNTGEAGPEYVNFRHYCSHLLPNREWADIRKLLAHGRSGNPAASLATERAKNAKSSKKRYERMKQEKADLEAKVALQARQIAALQAQNSALTAGKNPSEGRVDINATRPPELPRVDISASSSPTEAQPDHYDELFDVTDRVSREVEHERDRIIREWPASAQRRILERFHRGFGYDDSEIPIREAADD